MICKKCNASLDQSELIKCTTCQENLHYTCAGLSESDFKKILPMNLKKWKCSRCKLVKKPVAATSCSPKTPVALALNEQAYNCNTDMPSIVSIDLEALMKNMNGKFDQMFHEIAELKNSFKEKLDALVASVNTWSDRCVDLENTVSVMQSDLATVKEENSALRCQLNVLQNVQNDLDQKSRQCNIEIQNLPERKSENLLHIASAIGQVLGVSISGEAIKTVHRVAHNMPSDRPKNIVVELCSRRLRDDVVEAARARRGLSAGQLLDAAAGAGGARLDDRLAAQPVFINEHLTLKNKILYSHARREAKDKKYKYVWIKNAAILVRKDDSSRVVVIRSESDFSKL